MSKKRVLPKNYLASIRNIGVIAHIDAGKTTLTERILFYAGRIHRMGEVHDGTAAMDFMPEEQERGITISSAFTGFTWNNASINIIDTPGHVDFTIEVERSLRVLDGAVGVFCGVGGVEPQSETVWRQSEKYGVPKIVFINKMDREGADFEAVLTVIRERLGAVPLPIIVPVGSGKELSGLIDVRSMKKLVFHGEDEGASWDEVDPDEEEMQIAEMWRDRFLEVLSEADEAVLEAYMAEEEMTREFLDDAVRKAVLQNALVPVFSGTALKNMGVQPVMDAVVAYLPAPNEVPPQKGRTSEGEEISVAPDHKEPLCALAFKVNMETGRKLVMLRLYSGVLEAGESVYNPTQGVEEKPARLFRLHADSKERIDTAYAGEIVAAAGMKHARTGDTITSTDRTLLLERIGDYAPVISLALEPANTEELERLSEVLEKFLLEDPTLAVEHDEDSGQVLLSGMGELHLEVVLERLKREFNLAPRSGRPQVVFQETVQGEAEAEAEFDRMLGEVPHYGKVALRISPGKRDAGNLVEIAEGIREKSAVWLKAAEEGVASGLMAGVSGNPVRDVRVEIVDVDAKDGTGEAGCHMAAAMALKKALADAGSVLMEPLMRLEITTPEESVGDVVGLLGAGGAKVDDMFDSGGVKVVKALAPLRSLFGFSTRLRSSTQGRAGMVMTFERFDVL